MKKTIKVVGAVIENDSEEILCALRSPSMSLPNQWEFPGGKVEEKEDCIAAIRREITEELKCTIHSSEIFLETTHDYGDFLIHLITIKCKLISGQPIATEHSKIIWLKRENLASLNWAPADQPTVHKLIKEKV